MPGLKLGKIDDVRPVRLSIKVSAELHRTLMAYAEIYASQAGTQVPPEMLVPAMLEQFMARDRHFAKARRGQSRTAVQAVGANALGDGSAPKAS